MAAIRRAEATWSGALATGSGTVSAMTSGVVRRLPVSWAAQDRVVRRQDESRGAACRGARRLLRDGAVGDAGSRRDAAGAARRRGRGDLRQARCRLAGRLERADGARRGPGHVRALVRAPHPSTATAPPVPARTARDAGWPGMGRWVPARAGDDDGRYPTRRGHLVRRPHHRIRRRSRPSRRARSPTCPCRGPRGPNRPTARRAPRSCSRRRMPPATRWRCRARWVGPGRHRSGSRSRPR